MHNAPQRVRLRSAGWGSALLALALGVAFAPAVEAQAPAVGRVSGVVTDLSSSAPLSEVQVFLEGVQLGGLTRANGRFLILNVPAGSYRLVAARIGLGTVSQQIEVTAGGTVEVDFKMDRQALGLDEIVVTGTAGAARRREVGNSISQINTAELPQRAPNVSDMLQAAAPGVDVTLGGGGAGQGSKIRLRGNNSLTQSSDPIIYIDGIRMMSGAFPNQPSKDQANRGGNVTQSPLDLINPNDIERIEIIKGSAATTLYGTEASNGVIQVFTKRGSTGAPIWNAEVQQGTMWSQRFGYGDQAKYMYMDPWICTGFLKCGEYTHQAWTESYNLSVRGGGQNLQYFTSGEHFDERGNTPNDGLTRWTARGNFTFSPLPDLQIQWNTAYVNHFQTNSPQGNNAEGLELNVFRQNQNYFASGDPVLINRTLNQTLQSQIERFTTGGSVNYSPIAGLTNRFTIGYDYNGQETRNIRPFGFFAHPDGIIHNSTYQVRTVSYEYLGGYAFQLADGIRSSLAWGGQTIGDENRRVEGFGRGFPGAAEPTVSSAASTLGYEQRQKVWNAGFFFQNVFDIRDRYFITLGARMDGNSAFGKDFGLQFYPKASASWVVSDEGFWNPSWGQIKLRTAYGKSGRAPGAFDAVRTWTNVALAGQAAFAPANVGNAELGPEVTGELELGFDGSWLDDRIRTTYTYYRQLTEGALLNLAQMPSQGFTASQLTNVGEILNQGQEFTLDVSLLQRERFGWDVGTNVATNVSEVLSHVDPINVGRSVQWSNHTRIRNPDALPRTLGQIPLCTASTVQPGDPCRETGVYLGSNLPTLTVSGYTTLRLPGGISVSTRGEFRGGHYTTGLNPIPIDRSVRSPLCEPYYANTENVALKPDTPGLWVARCTPTLATGYSGEADYFKLRSITAVIPVDFIVPDRVQNATLTVTMGNIYTWSKSSYFGTWGFENFGNTGIAGAESASLGISNNERIPAPTTLRASLRFTF
jgi:TonB-dependent starch-binding outer membrane protein SusC